VSHAKDNRYFDVCVECSAPSDFSDRAALYAPPIGGAYVILSNLEGVDKKYWVYRPPFEPGAPNTPIVRSVQLTSAEIGFLYSNQRIPENLGIGATNGETVINAPVPFRIENLGDISDYLPHCYGNCPNGVSYSVFDFIDNTWLMAQLQQNIMDSRELTGDLQNGALNLTQMLDNFNAVGINTGITNISVKFYLKVGNDTLIFRLAEDSNDGNEIKLKLDSIEIDGKELEVKQITIDLENDQRVIFNAHDMQSLISLMNRLGIFSQITTASLLHSVEVNGDVFVEAVSDPWGYDSPPTVRVSRPSRIKRDAPPVPDDVNSPENSQ
jgi:hypothetical protein